MIAVDSADEYGVYFRFIPWQFKPANVAIAMGCGNDSPWQKRYSSTGRDALEDCIELSARCSPQVVLLRDLATPKLVIYKVALQAHLSEVDKSIHLSDLRRSGGAVRCSVRREDRRRLRRRREERCRPWSSSSRPRSSICKSLTKLFLKLPVSTHDFGPMT